MDVSSTPCRLTARLVPPHRQLVIVYMLRLKILRKRQSRLCNSAGFRTIQFVDNMRSGVRDLRMASLSAALEPAQSHQQVDVIAMHLMSRHLASMSDTSSPDTSRATVERCLEWVIVMAL